ncbi:hypothetical protein ACFCP7_24600 [Paenibacillus elgii]
MLAKLKTKEFVQRITWLEVVADLAMIAGGLVIGYYIRQRFLKQFGGGGG